MAPVRLIPSKCSAGPDQRPANLLKTDHLQAVRPPPARDNALREFRRALALHICGDQHLGSVVHYGIDAWEDAGFSFCLPAIGNIWPRRWYPPTPGENHQPGTPAYTGRYRDGFENRITVHAVANPLISGHEPKDLYDRATGYGIVRFNRRTREITLACWPRWVDPSKPGAKQYLGWPIRFHQLDNGVAHFIGFAVSPKIIS